MINRSNVISGGSSDQHVVEGYRFKVISEFDTNEPTKEIPSPKSAKEEKEEPKEQAVEQESLQETQNLAFQPSFVDDLLKKTDEMSSNIIKLQMQVESQESEFNNRLNTELENAKEKFTKEGYEKAKEEFAKEFEELKEKYFKSVAKLDEACVNLEIFIDKNEKELAKTAIEIAKEVISKELETNSGEVAYSLANELLEELRGALSIELKVSPQDFDFLKEKFKQNTKLKLSLDDAISKGSVVVISDVGNMESNINSRLMKIKKMANYE